MAVNDVVDLLRMLRRDDGAELEQAAGPEAITVVQEMDGVIRERLRQSDMYFSLWDEFDQDPDSNRAELIGAIEAAVEGDAEFGVRLKSLEEEYDELVVSDGPGAEESDDAGVLVAGFFAQGVFGVADALAPDMAGIAQLDFIFTDVEIFGRLRCAGDDEAVVAGAL